MHTLTTPLRALPAALASITVAAALAPVAHADSFAFRDGDDAKIVNADGSLTELVIDGTADEAASAPVVDAAGNLTAIMTMGKFSTPLIRWVSADGATVKENVLPEFGPHGLNAGPLSTAIDPSGKLFAYTYLEYTGTSSSYRPHLSIVDPTAPGSPTSPAIDRVGYSSVTWFGDRLVTSDATSLYAERPGGQRLVFDAWPLADGLTTADLSADGSRAVVGNGDVMFVVALSAGGPPAAEVTAFCALPSDGSDLYRGGTSSAAISDDGTRVAYAGRSGLRIARLAGVSGEGDACALEDVTLVSAKGGLPTSSPYTVKVPSAPGGPSAPGSPVPGQPSQPGQPKPGGGSRSSTAKGPTLGTPVRRGSKVTVTLTCPTTCRYTLTLKRGTRTLSSRKGKAKAGRTTKVTLQRARGKGLKVHLTVGKKTVAKKVG